MKLTKKQRCELHAKFAGRCAYCGVLLDDRWHADHLAPVVRQLLSKQTTAGTWKLVSGKPLRPEHDVLENMMPACAPCNISKGGQTLEGWRNWIAGHVNSLNSYHPIYRLAKSYGLIVETGKPVVFHFETVGPPNPVNHRK